MLLAFAKMTLVGSDDTYEWVIDKIAEDFGEAEIAIFKEMIEG